MKSYADAELEAARSSINTALIKLRRLVGSEEMDDESPGRVGSIRGVIASLDNIQRELGDI